MFQDSLDTSAPPETPQQVSPLGIPNHTRRRHFIMRPDRVPADQRPRYPRFGSTSTTLHTRQTSDIAPIASTDPFLAPPKPIIRPPRTHPLPTDGSFYNSPHTIDPCTSGCLLHILACGYGHKILTISPEPQPCARNCHVRKPVDLFQPRDIGQEYVCIACIVEHLKQREENRFAEYYAELQVAAVDAGKGQDWVEDKLEFVRLAWDDEDVEEVKMLTRGKQACVALWVEPEWRAVIERALMEERTGKSLSRIEVAGERAASPSPASSVAERTRERISSLRGSVYGAFQRPMKQVSTSTMESKVTTLETEGMHSVVSTPPSSPLSPPSPAASSIYDQNIPLWLSPGSPALRASPSSTQKPRYDGSEYDQFRLHRPWFERSTQLLVPERQWLRRAQSESQNPDLN